MNQPLKRGLYETEYGNTAYLSSPTAKTAVDLDSGFGKQRVPVSMLLPHTWKPVPKGGV